MGPLPDGDDFSAGRFAGLSKKGQPLFILKGI